MRRRFFPMIALSVLVACDGAVGASEEPEAGSEGDTGDDAAARGCAAEPRGEAYTLGMSHAGQRSSIAITAAEPAPPARGDNTWRVVVRDPSGRPIEGATVEVEPYMPDHMHGTSVRATVTPTGSPGELELARVNLFMPGLWDVTLRAALPDGGQDAVVFRFCVDP